MHVPDGYIRARATVTVELVVESLDAVSDLLHETWADGDPEDVLKACIVVDDCRAVERFSYEAVA